MLKKLLKYSSLLPLFTSCNNEAKELVASNVVEKKSEVNPLLLASYDLLSSDTITSPNGIIIKSIFISEDGATLKIEQIPTLQLDNRSIELWSNGIKESVLDTAKSSFSFHFEFDSDLNTLSTYISRDKKTP